MKVTYRRHTSLDYKDGVRLRKYRWESCDILPGSNRHICGFDRHSDYFVLTASYKYIVLCWTFFPKILADYMPTLKGEKI